MSDRAVVTFGRFQPVHKGHVKIINHVKQLAHSQGAEHHVFVSSTHDPKKNPLTPEQKVHFLNKMVPGTNVHHDPEVTNPLSMMHHLAAKGYKHVTVVVGSDRHKELGHLLAKYNGKDYHIPHLHVVSGGERHEYEASVAGMSSSKMRAHAKSGNFAAFRVASPNPRHARALYNATRQGMKVESNRALFIVGGPCSGKDALLRTGYLIGLNEAGMPELAMNKLHQAITNQTDIADVNEGKSLVVNGNADDLDKILLCKRVLEVLDYKTAMVFVYTTDEASKTRNDLRQRLSSKTFSEATRANKYNKSVANLPSLLEAFSNFNIFNNSLDERLMNEEQKDEVGSWKLELEEIERAFFEGELTIDDLVTEWLGEDKTTETGANKMLATTARHAIANKVNLPDQNKGGMSDYYSHNRMTTRLAASSTQSMAKTIAQKRFDQAGKSQRTNGTQLSVPTPPSGVLTKPSMKAKVAEDVTTDRVTPVVAKQPPKKNPKRAAKTPSERGDVHQGDGMAATATFSAEDTITELSKKTLTGYIGKAAGELRKAANAEGDYSGSSEPNQMRQRKKGGPKWISNTQVAANREQGIERAAKKLGENIADSASNLMAKQKDKQPAKKNPKAAVKPPFQSLGIRPVGSPASASAPLMAAEATKQPAKKNPKGAALEPVQHGDGIDSTGIISTTEATKLTDPQGAAEAEHMKGMHGTKSLRKMREELSIKSPDLEYDMVVEVYEDWGLEGEEATYEGRVIRTNKPFRKGKGYSVYVMDGTKVNRLDFVPNKRLTLQEQVALTDQRYWEAIQQ